MHYHRIPTAALEISQLGLGTMTFGEQTAKPMPMHNSIMPSAGH